MKFESVPKSPENKGTLEQKKTLERAVERANRTFRTWALSAIATFGVWTGSANAQTMQPASESKPVSHQSAEDRMRAELAVDEQRIWFLNYLDSKKFNERLTKEYLRHKQLGAMTLEDLKLRPELMKVKTNEKGDAVGVEFLLEGLDGIVYPSEYLPGAGPASSPDMKLDELFPDPDTTKLISADLKKIEDAKHLRKLMITTNNLYLDLVPDTASTGRIDGEYLPDEEQIHIREDFLDFAPRAPIHEYTHQSTDSDAGVIPTTRTIMNSMAGSMDAYLDDDREILARLNVFRYYLWQKGIYDPNTEDFTMQHLDMFLEEVNKTGIGDYNVYQLFQTLSREEIVWLMNNIAAIEPTNKLKTGDVPA